MPPALLHPDPTEDPAVARELPERRAGTLARRAPGCKRRPPELAPLGRRRGRGRKRIRLANEDPERRASAALLQLLRGAGADEPASIASVTNESSASVRGAAGIASHASVDATCPGRKRGTATGIRTRGRRARSRSVSLYAGGFRASAIASRSLPFYPTAGQAAGLAGTCIGPPRSSSLIRWR